MSGLCFVALSLNNNFATHIFFNLEHTCELPLETGPCLHELRQEIKEGKSEERSESCSKYLSEVLDNCPARGSTYTQAECEKQCGKFARGLISLAGGYISWPLVWIFQTFISDHILTSFPRSYIKYCLFKNLESSEMSD